MLDIQELIIIHFKAYYFYKLIDLPMITASV